MRVISYAERILSNMELKKSYIRDIILILSLILVAVAAIVTIRFAADSGDRAVVSVDGERVLEVGLWEYGEYPINGGTNTLVIGEEGAFISHASCPDGLCIRQGVISLSGERIVCLPNRVIVEIRSD